MAVHGSAHVNFVMVGRRRSRAPIGGELVDVGGSGRRSATKILQESRPPSSLVWPRVPRLRGCAPSAATRHRRNSASSSLGAQAIGYTRATGELDVLDPFEVRLSTPSPGLPRGLRGGRREARSGSQSAVDADAPWQLWCAINVEEAICRPWDREETCRPWTLSSRTDVSYQPG